MLASTAMRVGVPKHNTTTLLLRRPKRKHPHTTAAAAVVTHSTSTSTSSSNNTSAAHLSPLSAAASVHQRIPEDLMEVVQEYARKSQSPASLQKLLRTGQGELLSKACQREAPLGALGKRLVMRRICLQSAQFLRRELPIRLAHRIMDLDQVPYLRDMPAVIHVKGIYMDSFLELLHSPAIRTATDEEGFAKQLHTLYDKHGSVLIDMARGAWELRQRIRDGSLQLSDTQPTLLTKSINSILRGTNDDDSAWDEAQQFERLTVCHDFLTRFYTSRIGIRVLAGHYLALRAPARPNHVGMICKTTDVGRSIERASLDVTGLCERHYGRAPPIRIEGNLDLTFPYIPTYLHYILLELLKNAARATAETHANAIQLPPVTVAIADGTANEDVVIKISDQGGGIRRSQMHQVWSYLYTTADPSVQASFVRANNVTDHGDQAPIAGLGYGLPIARSYARYFGGDLDLISMEGYGTDAYVHLRRLGDGEEPLPKIHFG